MVPTFPTPQNILIITPTPVQKSPWAREQSIKIKDGRLICHTICICFPKKLFPWDITNSVFLLDMILGTILAYISTTISIYFHPQKSTQKIALALFLLALLLSIPSFMMKKNLVSGTRNGFIKQRMKFWFYLRTILLLPVIIYFL
jgi:hypothetical protein